MLPGPRHPACASPHRRREPRSPRSCRSRSGACRPLEPLELLAEARHWHHHGPKHKHRSLWLLLSQWPLWRASAACQTARCRQGQSTPLRGACRPIPAWPACAPRSLRCGLTVQAVSARVRARPRCTCGAWTSVLAAICGPCRSASTTWPPRPASTKSRVSRSPRGPPRRIRA